MDPNTVPLNLTVIMYACGAFGAGFAVVWKGVGRLMDSNGNKTDTKENRKEDRPGEENRRVEYVPRRECILIHEKEEQQMENLMDHIKEMRDDVKWVRGRLDGHR